MEVKCLKYESEHFRALKSNLILFIQGSPTKEAQYQIIFARYVTPANEQSLVGFHQQ